MEHYRKLERMYLAAPINAFFQPKLHIEEGWAEVRIQVRPDFHHTLGAMHGAVYFKAMDDAARMKGVRKGWLHLEKRNRGLWWTCRCRNKWRGVTLIRCSS